MWRRGVVASPREKYIKGNTTLSSMINPPSSRRFHCEPEVHSQTEVDNQTSTKMTNPFEAHFSATRPPTIDGRAQANIDFGVLMLVSALNQASLIGGKDRGEQWTPLSLLQGMVATYFMFGPGPASSLFLELQDVVKEESYAITSSHGVTINVIGVSLMLNNTIYLWKSCKMAASLVLLLAAHPTPESMYEALKPQSRSMDGMPTLESLKSSTPDSLSKTFQEARRAAIEEGKTTVMGVKLVDKHIFELVERGTSEEVFSFAHTFTMGVGPEGVVIWQAFGKQHVIPESNNVSIGIVP